MRADVPTIAPGERIEAAPTFRRFSNGANDPRGLVFNHTNWRFTPRSNGTGTKLSRRKPIRPRRPIPRQIRTDRRSAIS
jgi:hypothetical protein